MGIQEPFTLLRRFFSGLAEHTFQVRFGIVDPPLIDYLGELLIRYTRLDQPQVMRRPAGQTLRQLDQMMAEAESRIGAARREIHRQIGDLALFWTGLFPESLHRVRVPSDLDWYKSYCIYGKRAYLAASEIEPEEADAPADLLQRLGYRFEMCASGLREIRRQWEDLESGPGNRDLLWQ